MRRSGHSYYGTQDPVMNHSFRTTLFIPFHLSDQAGVVFFAHELTLFHMAYERFITEKLSISWHTWFQNEEWFVPLKHLNCNYLHPLFAGKDCEVEISFISISSSSFTLSSTLFQNGIPCCTIESVHVFCHKSSSQKIPIPNAACYAFKKILPT